MTTNLQVQLAAHPQGWVKESDFNLHALPMPQVADGQVLVRVRWLSLDPYMRSRMDEKSYGETVPLGGVMIGGTVGEIIDSRHAKFAVGDKVVGFQGWQQFAVSDGAGLMKIPPIGLPDSVFLSAAGMPGITAWYGLNKIGMPKAGETVVVSAASGAVGSVLGQLAKQAGCHTVGIAGGPAKCEYVTQELGFDACVDYKHATFKEQLKAATPKGIDFIFENVGGTVFDATLKRVNLNARVALCGLISGYNDELVPISNPFPLLSQRVKLEGFIISDHMDVWPQAVKELAGLVATGKLKYRETIAEGLESAPKAFIGMLKGENFGKQLVRVG